MRSNVHGALEASRQRNVVVAPDSEYILNNIALAVNVYPVCRNLDCTALVGFFNKLHFKILQNLMNLISSNLAAHKRFHALIIQLNRLLIDWLGYDIPYRTDYGSACKLLNQKRSPSKSVWNHLRIASPLKAETGFCLESVAFGSLSHKYRIEICTLQENGSGAFLYPAVQPSEHSGNAHRSLCVADHKVLIAELPFHTVQSGERSSFLAEIHNYLPSLYMVYIKGMQRITGFYKDVVCYVHYIVDRTEANAQEFLLHPVRRILNGYSLYCNATVSRSSIRLVDNNFHSSAIFLSNLEFLYGREGKLSAHIVEFQISAKVSGHADKGSRVYSVRSQANGVDGICLESEIVSGLYSNRCGLRKNHDAGMVIPHSQLILRAKHSKALYAPDLGFLDLYILASYNKLSI